MMIMMIPNDCAMTSVDSDIIGGAGGGTDVTY